MLPIQATRVSTETGTPQPADRPWSADEFAVGLATLGRDGEVLAHNACWIQLFGSAGPGVHLARLVHPEDAGAWRQLVEELARQPPGAQRGSQRFRFVHRDSGVRWLELSCTRQADRISAVAHDVTQSQRQLTGALADARSLRSLINGLPGLVYRGRNDRDWTMEVISQGCVDLTGHPAEDMRDGRRVQYSSLIVPDDVDYVWDSVQAALRSRQPYTLVYRIRSADGRLRNVLEKGQGVYSASGEVLAIEGAMYELTADALDRLDTLGSGVGA